MQPWTGEALAPAGGWRASIQDMGTLAKALFQGTAPGKTALNPVTRFAGPAARIGNAWPSLEVKGRTTHVAQRGSSIDQPAGVPVPHDFSCVVIALL